MAHNINRCSVCRHSVWRGAVPHLQVESQWQQNFFRINFWFANERQVHGEGECWPRLLGSIIHSWSVEPSWNFHNIQGPSSCWKCLLVLLSHHTASDLRNYAKRAFKHGESTWNWDFFLANIVKVSQSFVVSSNLGDVAGWFPGAGPAAERGQLRVAGRDAALLPGRRLHLHARHPLILQLR